MNDYGKALRDVLTANGCYLLRRGKGSHDIWYSPISNKNIAVAYKIKSRHTANDILGKAGINDKFS